MKDLSSEHIPRKLFHKRALRPPFVCISLMNIFCQIRHKSLNIPTLRLDTMRKKGTSRRSPGLQLNKTLRQQPSGYRVPERRFPCSECVIEDLQKFVSGPIQVQEFMEA